MKVNFALVTVVSLACGAIHLEAATAAPYRAPVRIAPSHPPKPVSVFETQPDADTARAAIQLLFGELHHVESMTNAVDDPYGAKTVGTFAFATQDDATAFDRKIQQLAARGGQPPDTGIEACVLRKTLGEQQAEADARSSCEQQPDKALSNIHINRSGRDPLVRAFYLEAMLAVVADAAVAARERGRMIDTWGWEPRFYNFHVAPLRFGAEPGFTLDPVPMAKWHRHTLREAIGYAQLHQVDADKVARAQERARRRAGLSLLLVRGRARRGEPRWTIVRSAAGHARCRSPSR